MLAQNSHPNSSFSNSPLFPTRNQCTTLNNSPHLPRILIQNRHLRHSHSGSLYFASLKSLSSVSYVQVKVTWRYSIQLLWRVCHLRCCMREKVIQYLFKREIFVQGVLHIRPYSQMRRLWQGYQHPRKNLT